MRLRTIGFKAHDLDIELAPNTLLVGPNGRGKSTCFDAIRFLGVGYVPALGKRPVDTAALMQNGTMWVEMSIPELGTARRSIERSGSGFTVGADASWIRNARPVEVGKQIQRLFGAEELDVAESLDIRQLLAATPNQRAARIEQLLASGQKPAEELARDVARFIVMRLADSTPERMPEDYKQAAAMIPEKQLEVLAGQEGMLVAKIKEAGLQGAVTWANEEKRRAAESAKSKQAAENQLRIRAAEVPEPSDVEIKRLESERGHLQQDLGVARERGAAAKRHVDAKAAAQRELDEAKTAEQDARTVREGMATRLEQLPKLREELKSIQSKIDSQGHEPPQQVSQDKAVGLEEKAQELEAQAAAITVDPVMDLSQLHSKAGVLEGKLQQANGSGWSEVKAIGKALMKLKSATASAKRLVELADAAIGEDLDEAERQLAQVKEDLKISEATNAELMKGNAAKEAKQKSLRNRAGELRAESKGIRDEYKVHFEREYMAWQESVRNLTAKKTYVASQIQTTEEQDRRTQGALDRAIAAVKAAEKRGADLVAITAMADAGNIEELAKKQSSIEERLATLNHAKSTHAEIRHILDSIAEAKAEHAVFAAIEWGLQQQRNKEISEAGGPLLKHMSEILESGGRKETPFIRAGAGVCNIGWKTLDGREIQIQALSGGEWCLFAGALTLAVILCRESQLKILLVEAGEADQETLGQLLAGIQKANEAGLFTAIVATPHANGLTPEGWNVVEVGAHAKAS
jgi:hypothetical protein